MQKFIKTNNTVYPVLFGFNALCMFSEMTDTKSEDIAVLFENMRLDHSRALSYVGLYYGARAEGIPFELSIDDVGDMMQADKNFFGKILKIFTDQNHKEPTAKEKKLLAKKGKNGKK